jgi:carboxylesterase
LAAPFRHEGSGDDTVLLLHGWTGSPAHLRLLGAALADNGYGVVAPLLAGHGTRTEHMLATSWRDWVRSAAEAAQGVLDDGRRLHVAGLSMGGIIGVLLAVTFDVASITTVNAPQRVHSRWAWAAPLLRGSRFIAQARSMPPPSGEGADYYHQYGESPVGTVADVMDLVATARRVLGRVSCPALVIQSHADETVKPVSGEIIYRGLGSARKRLVWLDHSRHVATIDHERHLIEEEVLRHLADAT